MMNVNQIHDYASDLTWFDNRYPGKGYLELISRMSLDIDLLLDSMCVLEVAVGWMPHTPPYKTRWTLEGMGNPFWDKVLVPPLKRMAHKHPFRLRLFGYRTGRVIELYWKENPGGGTLC